MRSRYSAFATRNVEYLWSTLHPDHDDRARSRSEVLAELAAVCAAHMYTGLQILDRRAADEGGIAKVLFFAKVFRKGRDLSFVELSLFARAEGGWRYLAGEGVERPVGGVGGMTIAAVEGSRARE
jgi:SEC-C motif-containing protein